MFPRTTRRGIASSRLLTGLTTAAFAAALLTLPATPSSAAPTAAAATAAAAAKPDRSLVRQTEGGRSTVVFGSGRYLTKPSGRPAGQVALDYLRRNHTVFALSAREAATFKVRSALVTPHDRATHLEIDQVVDGIRVDGGGLVALVDARGRLVMIGGRSGVLDTSGTTRLTAGQAIGLAARRGGAGTTKAPRGSQTKTDGRHTYPNPYADDVRDPSPVTAELVWHLRADRSLRLAWRTEVEVSSESWDTSLIDASTGTFIQHESLYHHSGPEGNVYTTEHPGVAGATQQVVPFTGINGSWVTDDNTSGNNVDAYRDRDNSSANDEYQPTAADQHFNYTFTDAWQTATDVTDVGALDADQDPAITQLFYYVNDMHDWLWGYGFDEASGNFQVSNPSGDGTGGDPVLAEAQDGWDFGCVDNKGTPAPGDDEDIRCLNNANFGTSHADGSTARMQMYMWVTAGNNPSRDGSMDGDVIAHEIGHGVAERLLPAGLSNAVTQSGGMSEGYSDALSFLRWGDAVIGDYATSNTATGVRGVAYDTSNRTYGTYNTSAGSPHDNGEIWATMLYDVRENLGIATTTQLVLDGMRNTANSPTPTFIDGRTGILAADMTNNGGANQCAIWSAFAENGLGVNAVSNGLHAAQTDNFDMPPECLPTADAGGPYSTDEGVDVTLDGSASTAGSGASAGALASYAWDLDGDGQYDDATGVSPTFTDVGQDGSFTVGLEVTDEFGNTDEDTATVTVDNVSPTVSIDPIPVVDEHDTTTITGTITDPGWEEDLQATIDFDDGAGPQPLSGTLENTRPDATLAFSVDHQYGDNGSFTVEVVGSDDDTSTSASSTAGVDNVDPTAVIDDSGAETYGGQSAFVVHAGEDLTVPVGSEDPGSDDLAFEWAWGDGATDTVVSLVNPPLPDPSPSPSVQPRDITEEATHAYVEACLYQLGVTVTDDDGGSANDDAVVLITGNADDRGNDAFWKNQIKHVGKPRNYTAAELECFLSIVGYLSTVFDESTDASTLALARDVLEGKSSPKGEARKLEQELLAAWLNFAAGAYDLDSVVQRHKPKGTTTFVELVGQAEAVRLDPTSTEKELKEQRENLNQVNNH